MNDKQIQSMTEMIDNQSQIERSDFQDANTQTFLTNNDLNSKSIVD